MFIFSTCHLPPFYLRPIYHLGAIDVSSLDILFIKIKFNREVEKNM